MRKFLAIHAAWAMCVTASVVAGDWRSFRGVEGSSSTEVDSPLPASFDPATGENLAWRADLPGRGVSGPIVAGGQVLVTASSGVKRDRLHVLAFDAETGEPNWHRQFWATGRTACHPTSANAAPTPASDGERVFAFYSSNDLVCLDLEGNMQWYRGLALDHPGLGNDVGMASSPVVAGDVVVVQCECQANSFAAAYDRETGEEQWSVERPAGANWASPVALQVEVDGELLAGVVLQSDESLTAFDAATGRVLWDLPMACSGIPSAAGGDGVLYAPGEDGLAAVATSGDHEGNRQLWSDSRLKCGNPSPMVTDNRLYLLNRAGVLNCVMPEDGGSDWKKRLGGRFWATPVIAGRRMYAVTDTGEVIIVDLDAQEILAKCSLGEDQEVLGSPAVADGALYVRSHEHLWKIAE